MDTWATSSLTPQIAGRWVDDPDLFARVFPMDLRPQGPEIIRTWLFSTVVRVALRARHAAVGATTTINGWILDPDRKKMSKSKGNVVTPMALFDQYGTDAVRYWAIAARPGVDTAFSEDQMKVGRRLATKLLNVTKFVLGIVGDADAGDVDAVTDPVDRAMLARLDAVVAEATAAFDGLRLRPRPGAHRGVLLVVLRRLRRARQGPGLRRPRRRGRRRRRGPRCGIALDALQRLLAPMLPFATEEAWSWWHDAQHPRRVVAGSRRRRRRRRRRPRRRQRGPRLVRRAKTEAKRSQRAAVARLSRSQRAARRPRRPSTARPPPTSRDALTIGELDRRRPAADARASTSQLRLTPLGRRRPPTRPRVDSRARWPLRDPAQPGTAALVGAAGHHRARSSPPSLCFLGRRRARSPAYVVVRNRDVVDITNPAEAAAATTTHRRRRPPTTARRRCGTRRRRRRPRRRRPRRRDVPARRPEAPELPHHRRRQRRLRRSRLAVRPGVRRPRRAAGSASAATRS